LDPDGLVVDIGKASMVLRELLDALDYRNLDDEPALAGHNTTTEFLARVIFERMAGRIAAGELGAGGLASLRIVLSESHVAWAAYEGPLDV
jgi:6-pyruvoyl-tetrahydropterin synthase